MNVQPFDEFLLLSDDDEEEEDNFEGFEDTEDLLLLLIFSLVTMSWLLPWAPGGAWICDGGTAPGMTTEGSTMGPGCSPNPY